MERGRRATDRGRRQAPAARTARAATSGPRPAAAGPHRDLLALQRLAGNAAVTAVVQRTIDPDLVHRWRQYETAPRLEVPMPSKKDRRDHEEVTMLIEELSERYPGGGVPEQLVEDVVAALNELPAITMGDIRYEIFRYERKHGDGQATWSVQAMVRKALRARYPHGVPRDSLQLMLQAIDRLQTVTLTRVHAIISAVEGRESLPSTQPTRDVGLFLDLLAERRGAYQWEGDFHPLFESWLMTDPPFSMPIPTGATLNCWEAIIVASAQAGMQPVGQLRTAFPGPMAMLTAGGTVRAFTHTGDGDRTNDLAPGDIVMVRYQGNDVHHVVAVAAAHPADYELVGVMSLWGAGGTGGLGRTTLGECLPPDEAVVRSVRFS